LQDYCRGHSCHHPAQLLQTHKLELLTNTEAKS
jgi:hypothetical protein